MAETAFRGPVLSLGATMDTSISPYDGPSMTYQGVMFPDPRFAPAAKDATGAGSIPGFLFGNSVVVVDQILSTINASTIAAAQVATSGTAMTLQTAALGGAVANAPSWTPGVPIIPVGTSVATTVYAIDFGFTTGTTTAASSTVVVTDNTMFSLGQWLVIGGAGDASNLSCLITQVTSIATANLTGITISPVAVGSLSHAPIGQGNLFNLNTPPGSQFGPAAASANAAVPYRSAGFGLAFDPVQAVSRSLAIAAATIAGGTATILVTGYDIYNNLMTELFTADGTTAQIGKKAFKYIKSIVPTAAGSATYTVGPSDVVGLPLRATRFGQVQVTMGNNKMATAAGFTAGLATTSNATTADVRGTLAVNLLGGAIGTSNGTSRLTVEITVPLQATINASPAASTSLFGPVQA